MTSSKIERPNAMEMRAIAREIGELLIQGERADYELGRLIDRVQEGQMWKWWNTHGGPFPNYERWIWAVCGFRKRKGRYLKSNYLALHAMNLSEDTFVRALRLGWCKLAHVLRAARTETDLLRWIDDVEDGMTEEDLRANVAIAAGTTEPTGDPDGADPNAEGKFKRATLPITFTQEEHLRAFMDAVKILRDRTDPEMGYGEVAGIMAMDYISFLPRDDEGGVPVELERHLRRLESLWGERLGIRFVADGPLTAASDPVPAGYDDGGALEF